MTAGGFGRANLPYGIFRRAGEPARVGVRFGDGVLDLAALAADGLLDDPGGAFAQPAFGQFGSSGRNIIDGPGYRNVDLVVFRDVPLGGRSPPPGPAEVREDDDEETLSA